LFFEFATEIATDHIQRHEREYDSTPREISPSPLRLSRRAR
jgi:hypothetical protein